MAVYEEAGLLLEAADKDWRALQGMVDPGVFAEEIFGFHAQQAVEKTLKAWLCLLGKEYPRTHDISLLLSELEAMGQAVAPFYDLIEFNPYAVQLRYEAFDDIGRPLEREDVVEKVGGLVGHVRMLIDAGRPPED